MHHLFPNTKFPFIANAPMEGCAYSRLASAVSSAGGYGFIAGGFDFRTGSPQLERLQAELNATRSLLGIATPDEKLPVGVGCLMLRPEGLIENVLPILCAARTTGICLSFPANASEYVPVITAVHRLRERENWDVKVFVQVGTVQAAREAIGYGVDVLVVQGSDAGGHQWAQGASVLALVPEVKGLLRELGKAEEVHLLAAGGIVDARGMVAAMGLGADGVFVATVECTAPDSTKEKLVSTTDGATTTVKSRKHDVFNSTDFWPTQYDGRAIIGRSYEDFRSGVTDEEIVKRHRDAREKGENDRTIIWAGAGVGSIKEVTTVKQLLDDARSEVRSIVAQMSNAFNETS
ncbi:2-nitropropane dioxygenase precursor [Aspergillus nomiae NRRL 13137]|uniref:2-nitropropane dioxygenase n=1 Tax=Aspergillus nomiae NRRL (strain ATCC 15546 / NRRL 13137 / CBS 260.88 / M93) TaxID=1509407 RepID=A0A0L1IW17_ASPN3|nr:2-nitropropane dioxygenase precursor [Aspergillus nomiae NRRL 13137]KNG83756.1 2-nitropropane dioxygenase precursor [Aspergillus nomiae NRRL 13137]